MKPSDFEGENSSLRKTFDEACRKPTHKIIIDTDGWVTLDNGVVDDEIGLGDIDVDVIIDDRRHTHDTIEDHVQCKECAQRACDATSKDMERHVD